MNQQIKKGDRVSVIDQTGFEGWGLNDCTVLYVDVAANKVNLQVNKGASHMLQERLDNIKLYSENSNKS